MNTRGLVCLLFGIAIWLSTAVAEAIPIVEAGSTTVAVGDTFSIAISITDAVDLTNYQFDLGYNPSLLQANSVTEGDLLATGGLTLFIPGVIDNSSGLISVVSNSLLAFSGVSGSGSLAFIEFTALASGTSPLTLSNTFVNFLDSGFTVTNGSVCVDGGRGCTPAVPEPGSFALLLIGGLLLWRTQEWHRSRTGN